MHRYSLKSCIINQTLYHTLVFKPKQRMQVCVFKVEIAFVLYLLCEYTCIYWMGIKLALHGYKCTHDLANPTCISAP